MKNRFLKLGFMAVICAMLSVSCSSCGGDDDPIDDTQKEQTSDNDKNPSSDKNDNNTAGKPADTKHDIADNVTAMSVAQQMYPGWNLGNTMEGSGKNGVENETSWQPTKTSAELAKYVKAQGFKSVRIPCNWYMHMSDPKTFTIDKVWMARVTEVVDYFLNEGFYVMLNEHWDGGWLEELGYSTSNSSYSAVSDSYVKAKADILKKIWTQIANNFKAYDEHLLFAGQNEPFQNWNLFDGALKDKNTTLAPTLMKYNQAFIDAVRATGGNNAKRALIIQAPGISFDGALVSNFALSTDTRENGLILEVHHYQPWDFCGNETGDKFLYWGKDNKDAKYYPNWLQDENALLTELKKLRSRYSDKGTPIIIGEYGCQWRDLGSVADANQAKHDASVKAFHKAVNQLGPENGMVPMVWDINACNREGKKGTMTVLDRTKLAVFSAPAMEGIQEGAAAAGWMK